MSRDIEIALMVLGRYSYLPRSEAVQRVADELGLTPSGVSGMTTRAEKTIEGRLAVMRYRKSKPAQLTVNEQTIQNAIAKSERRLQTHRGNTPDEDVWAVGLGDIHFPQQRIDALHLAYEIINHIQGTVWYVSVLNDGLDFAKISRWEDRRNLLDQFIDRDIYTQIQMHSYHMETLRQVAPRALFVGLGGNHELRASRHGVEYGTNTKLVADIAKEINSRNALMLNDLTSIPIFKISDGLIWAHGWYARKNRTANLKANYEQMLLETGMRTTPDFVMWHTHSTASTSYNNANLYNSGCLCNLRPSYTSKTPNWNLGIAISKFDPNGDRSETYNLVFRSENGRLRTTIGFREFSVPLEEN